MSSEHHVHRSGGGFSWFALLAGIGIGIAAALFYTWEIDPVIERNTAPWQLDPAAQENYVVAVAMSYAQNNDRTLAFNRLRALRPERDVWQLVADVACQRVKTGKTVTNTDIRVIRAMEQLYISQGASGCADGLYPTSVPVIFATPVPSLTPTPTLAPPATKTPTPLAPDTTPAQPARPTSTLPAGDSFTLGRLQSFCDPDAPGMIEVRVYDRLGQGIPGVPVTISWSGTTIDRFFTGLKPERGAEYADFAMTPGRSYTVTVPKLVSAPPVVEATACDVTVDGEVISTTTSYYINFQQRVN